MERALTREEFREQVFKRDKGTCVFCSEPAIDAHHVLERRLWGSSQGYYLSNGASVCSIHHIQCEETTISVEQVREACHIVKYVLPDHLYDDQIYDKWGNVVLPSGQRTKGELFYDESVQKILKQGKVLDLFTDYVKYPRTYHLPWSPGISNDDRVMTTLDRFEGQRVIVVEKLDGENSTLYSNYFHARSLDSKNHYTRNWAKALHAQIAHDIPKGWRLCCENLYAQHSIAYKELDSFLYGISIWNEKNECISWDQTVEWFQLFNIPITPIWYDGIFDVDVIKKLYDPKNDWQTKEGYVVRIADKFSYGDFKNCVGKYVRKDHVNTAKHWMLGQEITPNKLK